MRSSGICWSIVALALLIALPAPTWGGAPEPEQAPAASVLVLLPAKTFDEMRPMLEWLEAAGLTPRHVFPPDAVIVERKLDAVLPIDELPASWIFREGPIDDIDRLALKDLRLEIEMIWNANYHGEAARYGLTPKTTPGTPLVDDVLAPPVKDYSGPDTAAPGDVHLLADAGNPYGAANDNTSEYLSGKVAIGIFTVESDGDGENWNVSAGQIAQVKAEIQEGMNDLAAANPLSNLTFFYDYHDQCPTTIEPITLDSQPAQDIYIPECLAGANIPSEPSGTNYWVATRNYNRYVRNGFGADWAVSMFVVNSLYDLDGKFADGYSAYSYWAGPFLVMTYDNGGYETGWMNYVSEHEISHSFWAFDEYNSPSSPCTCVESIGYLNAQNQNCNAVGPCALDINCAMRSIATSSHCVHSKAQMGIDDTDGDGIPGVRDTFAITTLDPYTTPTADATPTLTGNAEEVPVGNQNSWFYTTRSNISLNRINRVEYRVDAGAWLLASAADGALDWAEEGFTLTTGLLPPGTHTVEARARNSVGNMEPAPYASRTFTVTSLEFANDECDGAEVIPAAGPFPYLTAVAPDITYASSTGDPAPPSCTGSVSHSVWYRFVPSTSGSYTISSCADAPTATTVEDTVIQVVTGAGGTCSGFADVSGGCDDGSCVHEGQQAVVTTNLTAGTTYFIVVYKRGTTAPDPGSTAVQLRVTPNGSGPPPNDECGGAEVIPASGPFPHLTAVTANITDATSMGDPAGPSCSGSVSRSIWYRFAPAVSGSYTISSCADSPTATTVDDTVIDIVTGASGTCGGFAPVSGGCDDHGCLVEGSQAVVTTDLTAGTTYFIVIYKRGSALPSPGNSAVQLRVNLNLPFANDDCDDAETIPGAGPFPHLTAVTADITDATEVGDPPPPSCSTSVSRSIWYRFVPAASGSYTVSSCADAPTGTTVDDTVIDIVTGAGGTCTGFTPISGGCDDQGCLMEGSQAIVTTDLTAGTVYFIVVYKRGDTPPSPGNTAVQLRVTQNTPPPNDLCAGAASLSLNIPLAGSTALGADDYRTPATPACFPGPGQITTDARGRDVVQSFTAPVAGDYAFRVRGYSMGGDPVLYLSDTCPAGPPPQTVSCLAASNRTRSEGVEEVSCVSLLAGESVYAFVDDRNSGFNGSSFVIEVEECPSETEPNDTPGAADPLACGMVASMESDGVDFFSLPAAATDWRVFAIVDGSALDTTSNLDLRLTSVTDTLEYDDRDNGILFDDESPNVAGTPVTSTSAFLRINDTREAEPYRIYAVTQPPMGFAEAESEPNDAIAEANVGLGDYYLGTLPGPSPSTDLDVFAVTADAGDLILIGLDGDPQRDESPINATLELLDAAGTVLVAVNDGNQSSDDMPSPNNLTATRPRFPAEAIARRVASAGTYYVRVGISPFAAVLPGSGDYLLSISKNCLSSAWADLSVDVSAGPDPVAAGEEITYVITLMNGGPSPASSIELADALPAGTTFVSVTEPPGWGCTTPAPGGTGEVVCSAATFDPEEPAVFTLVVAADICTPADTVATNTADVSSATADFDLTDLSSVVETGILASPATDTDGDGTRDACDADDDDDGTLDGADCAPLDPAAFAVPAEVMGLTFTDDVTLAWNSASPGAGSGTLHDVAQGTVGQWPVGSGAAEFCLVPGGTGGVSAMDSVTPSSRTARWSLVRGRNACGIGTYGSASSGVERVTAVCP